MDDLLTAVANIGFPIAVAVFLLTKIQTKLEELSGAVRELTKAVEGLRNII